MDTVTKNEQLDAKIKREAIVPGLIYGVVSLAMAIFSFYFTTSMTSSMAAIIGGPLVFTLLIPLVIAVFLVIDMRKKIGGYWSFRQAVTGIFIMFLISSLITFVGHSLIFAKFIEPNMVQKMEDKYIAATTKMLEKSGAEQDKIDEQVDKMKEGFDARKTETIGSTLKGLAISIVLTFVFAVIFAAIFKREPPMFEPIQTDTE